MAKQLFATREASEATAALDPVYAYLGVGVYTGDGVQIQPGAETGPDDFYIYDFLSNLLAQRYVERQTYPVDGLAAHLADLGVVDAATGQPLTAQEWLALLAQAASRGRNDASLLTLRLIDNLGLVRTEPLDLTRPDLAPETTYLDSVQFFLVAYDVVVGIAQEDGKASVAMKSAAGRRGGQVGGSRSLAGDPSVQSLYKTLLNMGFLVTLSPSNPATHWRHAASDNGRWVDFRVTVEFYLGAVRSTLNWGVLASGDVPIPPEGPVANADVLWVTRLQPWYGEFAQPGLMKTDAVGKANNIFIPRTEARPGEGYLKEHQNAVEAWISVPLGAQGLAAGRWPMYKQTTLTVARHQNLTAYAGAVLSNGRDEVEYNPVRCGDSGCTEPFAIPLTGNGPLDGSATGGDPIVKSKDAECAYDGTGGNADPGAEGPYEVMITATASDGTASELEFKITLTGPSTVTVDCQKPDGDLKQWTVGLPGPFAATLKVPAPSKGEVLPQQKTSVSAGGFSGDLWLVVGEDLIPE